jgi:ADP-dependent NAD(P)H-hydrate dehydratase / NAD(P)H-hydrate epimerase
MRRMKPEITEGPPPEPLLTTAEMAAVDSAAIASGLSLQDLITRAGQAVADAVCRNVGPAARIAVLCGPGNNGCDGLLAAAALDRAGCRVDVFSEHASPPGGIRSWAARQWRRPALPLAQFQPHHHDCIVDALYGAGLSRPIFGIEAEAIGWVNASSAMVLAVDVPSGLGGDAGQPLGPCVRADRTVTFFRRKPGHLLWPGREVCGEVTVADIGLTADHLAAAAMPLHFANAPALWRVNAARAAVSGHKYQRGHVLAVSGEELETGASRLAATAALRAGAGAVTLAGERSALLVHAAHVTAIMLREAGSAAALHGLARHGRFAAAVIGPAAGVGDATLQRIDALLQAGVPTVLDADAITSLAGQAARLGARPHRAPSLVLTPHAGEFARLFGDALAQDPAFARLPPALGASKAEQARAAARIAQSVVVFKGVDTVIADSDGRTAINENAGPELATAGSGDVLAGIVASHLAQGMPAFEAACAAVWLHGAVAASLGAGLTAEDLADAVRPLSAVM